MAKDKSSRTVNPATAALKADKAKSIKKNKTLQAKQTAEKLARRNPERLQRQIDELKTHGEKSGGLRPKDKQTLEELERDVKRIRKAREVLGDSFKKPERKDTGGDGVLGKRRRSEDGPRRDWQGQQQQRRRGDGPQSSDSDSDARDIPMPLDTANMPPVPRRQNRPPQRDQPGTSANNTPLGDHRREQLLRRGELQDSSVQAHEDGPHALPAKPAVAAPAAQTVYVSAPQIRNLQKEAVSRFVPTAVAQKIAAAKGAGGRLVEPEEADRLEKEGYRTATTAAIGISADYAAEKAADEAVKEVEYRLMAREEDEGEAATLAEEERRFAQEARKVELEEVEDEDL